MRLRRITASASRALAVRMSPDANAETIAEYLARTGRHPVIGLLEAAYDKRTPLGLKIAALSAAAPYCAPKLAATVVMAASAGPRPDAGEALLARLARLDVPLLLSSDAERMTVPASGAARREFTLAALDLLNGGEE